MKISTMLVKFVPAIALVAGMSGIAHADDFAMDPEGARESTVYKRQVNYQCQSGKSLSVTYGFNKQKLPTYAQANLNGKTRFMPLNMAQSDDVGTSFGDENNFSLSTSAMTLANYHKNSISTVQSPGSEILFKSCNVKGVKKAK
ncbi:adhesin [Moraxella boevrei]|uniref:ACP-like domain-containing protein n=1 Tax=Faucicola boevrei TaxID=346665 RepID=UPI0037355DFE